MSMGAIEAETKTKKKVVLISRAKAPAVDKAKRQAERIFHVSFARVEIEF